MAGPREAIATAVARKFEGEGLDASTAASLAAIVARRVTIDEFGRTTTPVLSIIDDVKKENRDVCNAFVKSDEPTTSDLRSKLDREMDEARAAAQADRQARADAITRAGNPFSARHRNLTSQSIIMNLAPAVAARLQAEARD